MRWIVHPLLCVAALAGVVGAGVGGCARYQPRPITQGSVERALAGPDGATLRVRAAELRHPMLRPIEIDLSRAGGAGITPEQASVLAVIVHPDLRAERARRAIAEAQLLQAGLLPNPQLVAGVAPPFDNTHGNNFLGWNAGPEWEVTSLITHDAKERAAAAAARSVDLDVAWREWQVAQAAKTAAWDVVALEQQLAAAREARDVLAQNLAAVRRAVERHDKTLLDLAAAETAAQDAASAALGQEQALARQRLALNRALGVPADQEVRVHVDVPLPTRLEPPATQPVIDGLEDRRLDLVALRKGYESEDQTLRAAVLAQFPKISLGFGAARDNSNVHSLNLGVTMDLPVFDRNQAAIATEKATREKLFDEYVSRVFAARADVATSLQDIRAANEQIAATEAAIPKLEDLVRSYETALNQGNADVLSYYTARGSLAQKRIDLVKLQQQLIENWIALEIAAGEYLPTAAATQSAADATPSPTTLGEGWGEGLPAIARTSHSAASTLPTAWPNPVAATPASPPREHRVSRGGDAGVAATDTGSGGIVRTTRTGISLEASR